MGLGDWLHFGYTVTKDAALLAARAGGALVNRFNEDFSALSRIITSGQRNADTPQVLPDAQYQPAGMWEGINASPSALHYLAGQTAQDYYAWRRSVVVTPTTPTYVRPKESVMPYTSLWDYTKSAMSAAGTAAKTIYDSIPIQQEEKDMSLSSALAQAAMSVGSSLAGGTAGASQAVPIQSQQAGGFAAAPLAQTTPTYTTAVGRARGRLMTYEVTHYPDGTYQLQRTTPGGVALYSRDLSAAKRVKRINSLTNRLFPRPRRSTKATRRR